MSDLEAWYFQPTDSIEKTNVINLNPEIFSLTEANSLAKVLTYNFLEIRKAELEIFDLMERAQSLKQDNNGDLLFDEKGKPIEIYDKPPETDEDHRLFFKKLKNNLLLPELVYIWSVDPSKFSIRLDYNIIEDLDDVYHIDSVFVDLSLNGLDNYINCQNYQKRKAAGYNCYFIYLVDSAVYHGGVWIFTHPSFPEFLGMYAIRSSLVNILNHTESKKTGIANRIIEAIIIFARQHGQKRIIVPWPLEIMTVILKKLGFAEHNTNHSTRERQFLSDVTCTSNYYTLDIDKRTCQELIDYLGNEINQIISSFL